MHFLMLRYCEGQGLGDEFLYVPGAVEDKVWDMDFLLSGYCGGHGLGHGFLYFRALSGTGLANGFPYVSGIVWIWVDFGSGWIWMDLG